MLQGWLEEQDKDFRKRVQVAAMDAFTGFKAAATQALPEAREVMAPLPRGGPGGDKLNQCRRRLQRQTTGHRGRNASWVSFGG